MLSPGQEGSEGAAADNRPDQACSSCASASSLAALGLKSAGISFLRTGRYGGTPSDAKGRPVVLLDATISLDGFMAGPNHEVDWVLAYKEPSDAARQVVDTTGAFISGRRSYDGSLRAGGEIYGGAWSGAVFVVTGGEICRQALDTGLVDEIQLHVAPVLLGNGIRLFDTLRTRPVTLEIRDVAAGELIDRALGSSSRASTAWWTRA